MNRIKFLEQQLRHNEAEDLKIQLQREDLTREMVAIILERTVEICIDAYGKADEETGDMFARLNGDAETRWYAIRAA